MPKLLIISGSSKVISEPADPISALTRFNGGFVNVVRNYYGQLKDVDVLILSPVFGLVGAEEKIGYKEPINGSWHNFLLEDVLSGQEIANQRNSNLSKLRSIFSSKKYDEVYVIVGYQILKLVKDFEDLVSSTTTITYARGGMGEKMRQMRDWIQLNLSEV